MHARVDTDADPELAASIAIRSVPTTGAFRDGVLIYHHPGAMPSWCCDA